MSNWINGSFIWDEPFFLVGSRGEGGKQATKKKPKRKSQLAHSEAFPGKDALFLLPKPIALPHPAQLSSVAGERRRPGICVGRWIPARGSLLPRELGAPYPAYLATDQKTILVFSKDSHPHPHPHGVLNPSFKPLLVALGRTPGSPEDKTM